MPRVTMIAGPNGSGKSTLIAQLRAAGVDLGEYLNADDVARAMATAAQGSSQSPLVMTDSISRAAQIEVRERREAAVAQERDYSFETVMSHLSHLDHLSQARARGFSVVLYFVATAHPLINTRRVANRVLHGGHDVPTDRIVTRYRKCLDNLPAAIALADEGMIFDNSRPEDPLRRLAKITRGRPTPLIDRAAVPDWWRDILDTIA